MKYNTATKLKEWSEENLIPPNYWICEADGFCYVVDALFRKELKAKLLDYMRNNPRCEE